jgi:hypothetical protein
MPGVGVVVVMTVRVVMLVMLVLLVMLMVVVAVLLSILGFLARFLRHIVLRVLRESWLHGPPVGRVSLVMVRGRVASMLARAMSIMPVVAHVSTSCWRESVLAPRLPCHQKSLQAE